MFGPAPVGVPNFVIDSFEIPPFLLPIYQACGTEYGVPWEVLAAINKIETGFGTNLNVSSAGAMGWMQFLPSSWETYGLDANGDGREDPYNPVDAICAAAHYLKIAGAGQDLYKAIFSYNHADWYVQEVLLYAHAYGKLPADLVGSLTGLTEGAHFPVAADARYADELSTRAAIKQAKPGERHRFRQRGDRYLLLPHPPRDQHLRRPGRAGGRRQRRGDRQERRLEVARQLHRPPRRLRQPLHLRQTRQDRPQAAHGRDADRQGTPGPGQQRKHPPPPLRAARPGPPERSQAEAHEKVDSAGARGSDGTLKVGSRVIGGTVLARIGGASEGIDPHINFSIRPAGRGAPRIDPKPILDGWKLLEATAIYRANGKNPLTSNLGGAGVLLLSKEALERRVLDDKALSIYPCGRTDIATGQIDRRVLAMLEYLISKGFRLGITALKCGHSYLTSSGNVSEHSTGTAVDIAEIDGVPVTGHQGPGTAADELIKTVLQLQGSMHPHQVISLEDLPGETSFALPDHYDHVHIGYSPGFEAEYVSPFVSATQGRIDMGVDFTGAGPIVAIGNARILATGAPGWPEGGGVLYRLLDGPEAGSVIYVYEGVSATVRPGQWVAAGQQIASFVEGGSIEIGFADSSGAPLSHASYQRAKKRLGPQDGRIPQPTRSSTLFSGFGELAPDKWDRLIRRLGEIENPEVRTKPSKRRCPTGTRGRARAPAARAAKTDPQDPGESGPLTAHGVQTLRIRPVRVRRSAAGRRRPLPCPRGGRGRSAERAGRRNARRRPRRREGAAGARARPTPTAGRRPCRWPGPPRSAPSTLRRRAARRRPGSTRAGAEETRSTPSSPRASAS